MISVRELSVSAASKGLGAHNVGLVNKNEKIKNKKNALISLSLDGPGRDSFNNMFLQ